jgi:hypothetical protein
MENLPSGPKGSTGLADLLDATSGDASGDDAQEVVLLPAGPWINSCADD